MQEEEQEEERAREGLLRDSLWLFVYLSFRP
jgi:hypothetical protein